MKKSFTTGLIILLPLFLTAMIVILIINVLTQPFLEKTEALIAKFGIFQQAATSGNHLPLLAFTSKVLILTALMTCVLITGFVGRHFILVCLFRFGNRCLNCIPLINAIFHTSQELVQSLLSSKEKTFSQVVYVPFPQKDKLSLGFVTCDEVKLEHPGKATQEWVSVFVPGTPNPTAGCLLLFRPEDLIFVDMKVDEAMRFIVSCGIPQPLATYDS